MTTSKPSNPKDSVGIKKVYYSVIPWGVVAELGLALLEGALKYGRHNYRAIGVRGSVYYDATLRHLTDWWEGVDTDPDSGLSHITKAIASLTVLRDSMIRGNWEDDRPPRMGEGWLQELNKKAAALVEKYPEPAHTYTQSEVVDLDVYVKNYSDPVFKSDDANDGWYFYNETWSDPYGPYKTEEIARYKLSKYIHYLNTGEVLG